MKPTDQQENKIRIMLADDHLIVREGLVTVLGEEPDFEFVGFAEDGEQACEEYARLLPDVLLLDLRMPKRDGIQVARELVSKFQAKVIILTTFDNEEDLKQSLKAGAKGYLLKEAEKEEIADAVRTVSQGSNYLPAKLGGKLATFAFRAELTERELEVLRQMCEGKSNKEIGSKLFITEGTVKTHVKSIFYKMDVISRSEAVSTAIRRGLVRGHDR
ncbi:MAG: response regulator transcription factor [Verrucomicrobia bacterium]|nr:response regulator transcription factor [Verrucomicrobiota bacterium]MBV8277495.1 response regulator transcription factor [Verrucomicrobiota bacterium]